MRLTLLFLAAIAVASTSAATSEASPRAKPKTGQGATKHQQTIEHQKTVTKLPGGGRRIDTLTTLANGTQVKKSFIKHRGAPASRVWFEKIWTLPNGVTKTHVKVGTITADTTKTLEGIKRFDSVPRQDKPYAMSVTIGTDATATAGDIAAFAARQKHPFTAYIDDPGLSRTDGVFAGKPKQHMIDFSPADTPKSVARKIARARWRAMGRNASYDAATALAVTRAYIKSWF